VLQRREVNFMIASRVPERAHAFADTVAGIPIAFDTALEMLRIVDVIFTATMAPYRLITYERIVNAMTDRKEGRSSMMIFDLSIQGQWTKGSQLSVGQTDKHGSDR
jgi:glutamyl-tRNA reductase